jgi:hypothetical protein
MATSDPARETALLTRRGSGAIGLDGGEDEDRQA